MEINPFILALSKTLPESCLQGLAIYLLLQLLFLVDKRSTPLFRFNLLYVLNCCLFAGFVLSFVHHYQQTQVTASNPSWFSNTIKNNNLTTTTNPNLWLQVNFWTSHYANLITGFYLLGLLFCMLKLIIGLINISWFRSNRNLKLDDYLTQISIQLSSNFRLIKTASVFVSDKIFVPFTIGFIKPIIVFPIALINQLSAEQTEAILLHELAHIKRNDYLLNILLCIVQSFLFFNPAIWLMKRETNQYREQCCDDLVVNTTSHKTAYAHALLLIEQNRSEILHLTLASNGKKYTLLNRIKRITNMKDNQPSPQNKLVVILLALITIGLTVAWNLPEKKATKYFINQHFKAINEARDTNKVEQFKDVYYADHSPVKRNKLFNKKSTIQFFSDTTIKSKNKFKIVLEDSVGNKKEYNSIDELPVENQKEFLKQNIKFNQLQGLNSFDFKIDTSDFASIKKQFDSPEWKKQMADIQKQGLEIQKQFNSPEWKKQMADIRKQGVEIQKQFNSPKWKKQMAAIQKQGEDIQKQFNSPEWKKQVEKSIDSARKNWKNSSDEQRKLLIPEKPNQPKSLNK